MKKFTLLLLLSFMTLHAEILQVKQLFNLKTTAVKEVSFSPSKQFYAKTALDESRVKGVSLRTDAFVTKLYVDETYQKVAKGDPLFRLYAKEAITLHDEWLISRSISKQMATDAKQKLRQLDLEFLTKETKRIEEFDYPSPYSGIVIQKEIVEGSAIPKGKNALMIADYSKIWVIAKVPQKDIGFVAVGAKADVKIEGVGKTSGVVEKIYPDVDPKDQSIAVRIVIENAELAYYPGLFAKVRIANTSKTMLQLPKSAVLKKAGKYYVFRPVGEGQFEPKEIKATRISATAYEILSGLKKDEVVIDDALFMLDSDAVTNALYESEEDEDW